MFFLIYIYLFLVNASGQKEMPCAVRQDLAVFR
jgi:hypothetical protein